MSSPAESSSALTAPPAPRRSEPIAAGASFRFLLRRATEGWALRTAHVAAWSLALSAAAMVALSDGHASGVVLTGVAALLFWVVAVPTLFFSLPRTLEPSPWQPFLALHGAAPPPASRHGLLTALLVLRVTAVPLLAAVLALLAGPARGPATAQVVTALVTVGYIVAQAGSLGACGAAAIWLAPERPRRMALALLLVPELLRAAFPHMPAIPALLAELRSGIVAWGGSQ